MQKTNHAAIGAFVVGALILTIICIMLFGSGGIFETNISYTLSFDKSVKGLSKGAPVMFRGIKIGEVTDIKLSFDNESVPQERHPQYMVSWPITVTINLFPYSVAFEENRSAGWLERMLRKFYPQKARETMETWLADMIIKKGLRGQLQSQNLLTGMLYIELDLFHEEQAQREVAELVKRHIIPTRFSAIERLYLSLNQNNFNEQINHFFNIMNSLGNIFKGGKAEKLMQNLVTVTQRVDETLASVNGVVKDLKKNDQVKQMLANAAQSLQAFLKTMETLQAEMPNLLKHAETSMRSFSTTCQTLPQKLDATLSDARTLMTTLNQTANQAAIPLKQLNETLVNLNLAATEGARLLAQTRTTLGPDSPVVQNLSRTVISAQQAAQSVKALADQLTDYPETLIRGRADN